jgi:endo-1,4-beta-xylanase
VPAAAETSTGAELFGVVSYRRAREGAEPADFRAFADALDQVADRGLTILITELDVLDDGLPADIAVRDRGVADVYRRYLDVTLDHKAVKALITFGLSDRYTWLQEDLPREDGAARRPLPFDEDLQPKPAYRALSHSLRTAPWRKPVRRLHRDH